MLAEFCIPALITRPNPMFKIAAVWRRALIGASSESSCAQVCNWNSLPAMLKRALAATFVVGTLTSPGGALAAGTSTTISVTAPASVQAGDTFTVGWTSTNATEVHTYCRTNSGGRYIIFGTTFPTDDTASATAPVGADTKISCTFYAFNMVNGAAQGVASASRTITIVQAAPPPAPTISVSRSPSPMTAGKPYSVSWSSSNATSVSSTCQSGVSAANGSATGTASSSWVSSPPSCTWTATGAGGTASYSETLSTVAAAPNPTISGSAPSAVAAGASFTLGWNATDATDVAIYCSGSPSSSYPVAVTGLPTSGSRSFTAPNNGDTALSCSFYAHGAATVGAYKTISISAAPPPPPAPSLNVPGTASVQAGSVLSIPWTTTNASSVSYTCTSGSGSGGSSGSTSVGISSSAAGTAYSCKFTATGDGGSVSKSTAVTVTAPAPVMTNAASYVTQTTPPSNMSPGEVAHVSVTMKNTGTTTWTAADGYRLGAQNPQDNSNWGLGRVELSGPVAPGGSATFAFDVIAPSTPGAYNFQWRMLKESVEWFGASSTNQAVTVAFPPPVVSVPSAASVVAGSVLSIPWSSTNAISVNYACTGGVSGSGGPTGSTSVSISAASAGTTYSCTFTALRGSETSAAKTTVVTITAPPVNGASFVSQVLPLPSMVFGQSAHVSVTMKNTGTTTWSAGQSYMLGSQNPQDNANWGLSRVQLDSSVAPGQSHTFSFDVKAPTTAGTYNFQWRMLRENVEWFGASSANGSVDVRAKPTIAVPPTVWTQVDKTLSIAWSSTNATGGVTYSCDTPDGKVTGSGGGSGTFTKIAAASWANVPFTCTFVAHGAGNVDATGLTTVTTKPRAPTISISPTAQDVVAGSNVSINWSATDTNTIDYSCSSGATSFSGTDTTGKGFTKTTSASWVGKTFACHVTLTGDGGTGSGDAAFTVVAPPPSISVQRTPDSPQIGQTVTWNWTAANSKVGSYNCIVDVDKVFNQIIAGSLSGTNGSQSAVMSSAWAGRQVTCTFIVSNDSTNVTWDDKFTLPGTPITPAPVNGAQFVSLAVPAEMVTGRTYPVSVTFKNTGSVYWDASKGFRLRVLEGHSQDLLVSPATMTLPGATETFKFNITAPAVGGLTIYTFKMEQSGVTFGGTMNQGVNVTTLNPVVSFTSPAANATVMIPSGQTTVDVPVTGTASGKEGATISKIELLKDGAVIASAAGASLSTTVRLGSGKYVLYLRAYDSAGRTSVDTASSRSFTVRLPKPAIKVTRPAGIAAGAPTDMIAGKAYMLTWSSTDAETVTYSCGYAGQFANGSAQNGAPGLSGSSQFTAQQAWVGQTQTCFWDASNHDDQVRYTEQFNVLAPPAPVVSVAAIPATIITAQDTTSLQLGWSAAYAAGATFASAKVFDGATQLAASGVSGAGATVMLGQGAHSLKVSVTDSNGQTGTSGVAAVSVQQPAAPTVAFTSPTTAQSLTGDASGNATLAIAAKATASGDATITKIELFDGAVLLASSTNSVNLNATPVLKVGSHTLTLKVYDSVILNGANRSNAGSGNLSVTVAQGVIPPGAVLGAVTGIVVDGNQNQSIVGWACNTNGTQANTVQAFAYPSGTTSPGVALQSATTTLVDTTASATCLTSSTSTTVPRGFSIPLGVSVSTYAGKQFGVMAKSIVDGKFVQLPGYFSPMAAVTDAAVLSATLRAPTTSFLIAGGTAPIALAGSGTAASGTAKKLEVFEDAYNGKGWNPVSSLTVEGNVQSLTLPANANVARGVGLYRYKLRVTSADNKFAESLPVVVSVESSTSSGLLGEVNGVQVDSERAAHLTGWACKVSNAEQLTYQLLLNAPTAASGGTLLSSGKADSAGEGNSADVQAKCGTPGVGHSFSIDLVQVASKAGVQIAPGTPLFVAVKTSTGSSLVLPCTDFACTMPGSVRIGFTGPNEGDRIVAGQPLFMRALLSGSTPPYDEVSFTVDGMNWLAGTADATPNAYFANKIGLAASVTPYTVQARVRQNGATLYATPRRIYVMPSATSNLQLLAPTNGLTLPIGMSLKLMAKTGSTTPSKVQFYVNGKLIGQAQLTNGAWVLDWKPTLLGSQSILAAAYDGAGKLIDISAPSSLNIRSDGSDPAPVAIQLPVRYLSNTVAGTLPGQLTVTNSGSAAYSIPIAVPPGTNGMVPVISLNYSSDNSTGSAGLGWSLGGISNLDRCGKTTASDGVTDAVRLTSEDRLCLDGERLVLASGATDSASYWADGAEYRTEIESFTRVTAMKDNSANRYFRVMRKNQRIAYYGSSDDSRQAASLSGQTPSPIHRWRIKREEDRAGNIIDYTYSNDATNGENKPLLIQWGRNEGAGTSDYAKVEFKYEDRPDARHAYVAGSPNYELTRLSTITTATNTDGAGNGGILAQTTELTYGLSPTSTRSLLASIRVCDGACSETTALPATTFTYGRPDPGAVHGFVPLGAERIGPNLAGMGLVTWDGSSPTSELIFVDLNGDGRSDVLERRNARTAYLSNWDGTEWAASTPLSGVSQSTYIFASGDFEGNGDPELLVAEIAQPGSKPTGWRLCHSHLQSGGGVTCDTPVSFPGDAFTYRYVNSPNEIPLSTMVTVKDLDGDGRDDVFLGASWSTDPVLNEPRYICMGKAGGFGACTKVNNTAADLGGKDDFDTSSSVGTEFADVDGNGRVDTISLERCTWGLDPYQPGSTTKQWNCGISPDQGDTKVGLVVSGPSVAGERSNLYTGWYVQPTDSVFGLIPMPEGGTLSGDLNADGLTDVVFGVGVVPKGSMAPSSYKTGVCFSAGNGKAECRDLPASDMSNADQLVLKVADFDGDGALDVLHSGSEAWENNNFATYRLCKVAADGAARQCSAWTGPNYYSTRRKDALVPMNMTNTKYGDARTLWIGDVNGDGMPDFATYLGANYPSGANRWQVYTAAPQNSKGEALDKLVKVVNGVERVESVKFAAANDPTVYMGAEVDIDGNPVKRTYPVKQTPNTRALVSTLTRSNGVSGESVQTYKYAGYAVDATGRGNLGFAMVQVHDATSMTDTSTWYSQQYPWVGMMTARLVTHPKEGQPLDINAELERTTVTLGARTHAQSGNIASILPFVDHSASKRQDLNGVDMGGTTTTYGYDDWMNLASEVSTTVLGNQTFTQTVTTVYNNDGSSNWLIGQPANVTTAKNTTVGAANASLTRTVDFTYYSNGQLWTETRERGSATHEVKTTYERNQFGLVSKTTLGWKDPIDGVGSRSTSLYYDAIGRFATYSENDFAQRTSQSFDPRTGAPTSVTGINGLTNTIRNDGFGRKLSETGPDGGEVSTVQVVCSAGCPAGATVVQVRRTLMGSEQTSAPAYTYFDSAGHLLRTETAGFDGAPVYADIEYDAAGRESAVYQPYFADDTKVLAKRSEYDDLGRIVRLIQRDESNVEQTWRTDYNGWETTYTQPAKGQGGAELSRKDRRDVWGRLLQATDSLGFVTHYEHDPFGNLTQTTDAKGNVVQVTYDPFGYYRTQLKDPDLGTMAYKVNAIGQVREQQSANQLGTPQKTSFTFDKLGRMTKRAEADLTSNWVYDNGVCAASGSHSCGQLVEADSANGTSKDYAYVRTHSFDQFGRPAATSIKLDETYTSTTEYDPWGRVIRQKHQRGAGLAKAFDYRYNEYGALARIERGALTLWKVTQEDAAGRMREVLLGNGLTAGRTYDANTGRLIGADLVDAAHTSKLTESYFYDALGNIKQRSVYWDNAQHFMEMFTYDDLNRLATSWIDRDGLTKTFEYDEIGNIVSKTDVGTGHYVYNASGAGSVRPHAVSSIPGVGAFNYDLNGNLLNGAGRTITWTSFDMPSTVTKDKASSEFVYGPEHQRTLQRINGTSKVIYYAGAMEVEMAGSVPKVKTYWPNGLGFESDDGNGSGLELHWTHVDRLGSVIAMTGADGAVQERMAFDSWGKRRNLENSGTPDALDGVQDNKGYTGHEMLDQVDLVHMNGRVYDPLVARFLSADPLIQDPEHSQSYNRYAYVWNNPTNLTDPTGFFSEERKPATGCGNVECHRKEQEKIDFDRCAQYSLSCGTLVVGSGEGKSAKGKESSGGAGANNQSVNNSVSGLDPQGAPSAFLDTGKAVWNTGVNVFEGGVNLLSGALPGGSDYYAFANGARLGYDTPVFGEILELLMPLKLAGAGTAGRTATAGVAEGEALFGICFISGTSIQTPTGIRNIEDIQVGDVVYAVDPGTNQLTKKPVVRVFHNSDRPIIRVTIGDGSGQTQSFGATAEHPFWVESKGWVPAGQLQRGDALRSISDAEWRVLSVADNGERADTFNFEVQELHNYFVGPSGVLVHNQSKLKGGESPAAARGREAHKNYENALGKDSYEFNKALPSGRRPDAVDYKTNTVRELKPDSPGAMRRGWKQLESYAKELEALTGKVWTRILDTYRR